MSRCGPRRLLGSGATATVYNQAVSDAGTEKTHDGRLWRQAMYQVGVALVASSLLMTCGGARGRDAPAITPSEARLQLDPSSHSFQGIVELAVDATDTAHRVFHVQEVIPVQAAGDTVLLYPEWETASHAPTASAIGLAGLTASVDGREVEWHRDPKDPHTFHIDAPLGAKAIALAFDFLAPRNAALLRADMVDVQWQRLLLYPAGWPARHIPVHATLVLLAGLRAFTALTAESELGNALSFKASTLERLIDAPVYAARYWQTYDLRQGSATPVTLDVVADDPKAIAPSPPELEHMRRLVSQSLALFGAPPFRHYDAIVSLSDKLSPGGGIEHLEEGENNLPADYFIKISSQLNNRDLIAHELVHAWNGRSVQPVGMSVADYNSPSDNNLLWVYEGQTEFWGRILAARSGLRSRQQTLDKLAMDAAIVANRPGRAWKTLEDSTNDPVYMAGHAVGWREWQRREDYYAEGVLLWLDVDARLRELTANRAGLDDFAQRFFAADEKGARSYTFNDLCAALAAIAPEDWSQFLLRHLHTHDTTQAMAGLERAGWRLTYDPRPTETFLQEQGESSNFDYSIGLQVDDRGTVQSVLWQGPAFGAGLSAGCRIVRINGEPFSTAALVAALGSSARDPLVLAVEDDGEVRSVELPYSGGLRYPHLERISEKPDRLSPLLLPRRWLVR